MSWHCLLAGYGNFPDRLVPAAGVAEQVDMARIDKFVEGCAMNFPSHRSALERIAVTA